MGHECERCGKPKPPDYKMHDYCAGCGKTLCPECMRGGCCGKAPAESGMEADYGDAGGVQAAP